MIDVTGSSFSHQRLLSAHCGGWPCGRPSAGRARRWRRSPVTCGSLVTAEPMISQRTRSHLASIPFLLTINTVNFLGTEGIKDGSEVSRQMSYQVILQWLQLWQQSTISPSAFPSKCASRALPGIGNLLRAGELGRENGCSLEFDYSSGKSCPPPRRGVVGGCDRSLCP